MACITRKAVSGRKAAAAGLAGPTPGCQGLRRGASLSRREVSGGPEAAVKHELAGIGHNGKGAFGAQEERRKGRSQFQETRCNVPFVLFPAPRLRDCEPNQCCFFVAGHIMGMHSLSAVSVLGMVWG